MGDPECCGPGIFDGGGIGVFGRQPVVDGHHDGSGTHGMLACRAVVGVQIADDEAPPWKNTTTGCAAESPGSVGGQ